MKVAVVTGASTGIGRAIAVAFAKKGYAVSICARSADGLAKTKQECVAAGLCGDRVILLDPLHKTPDLQVVITIGDLTDKKVAEEVVRNTVDKLGSIDVLVNNAGFAVQGGVLECSGENFDKQFNLNVKSVVEITSLCLPHLIKAQGAIINISSSASIIPFAGTTLYCMSKAALDMYTKCLSLELASKKVRANSVNPGFVATDFAVAAGFCTDEEKAATYEKLGAVNNPMGRTGTMEEVANAVYFLASPESSFTTGAILNVDGGRLWAANLGH